MNKVILMIRPCHFDNTKECYVPIPTRLYCQMRAEECQFLHEDWAEKLALSGEV